MSLWSWRNCALGSAGATKGPGLKPAPALPNPREATEDTLAPFLANRAMADIERVAILATLGETRGNKTEAARRLGLTARTLSNKLKLWRQAGHVA